jgi:TolB-like protein/DNA-binding winged helix-turn-helix (wHTH) protein/Tfp pilus assembly protein PilF
MDHTNVAPRRVRFGVFEADFPDGELTKQGKRISLQEQPFRLLAMLLERPGELVTREEVRQRLWPSTIVDFDHGLNKAINKIRDALGDSADKPRFVETVARRGYRFLADVQVVDRPEPGSATIRRGSSAVPADATKPSSGPTTAPTTTVRRRPFLIWLACTAASMLVLITGWELYLRLHAYPAIHSLVVLPLANLSDDPSQDYFADGMTDELITQLGQISALRVISSTSAMAYKNVHKPLADIARELDVQAVVEGSVLRVGDRIRINAQLIRVPADRHLWAQSYEGNFRDTLALQGEVSQAIASQIQATVSRREQAALSKPTTVNAEAHEAYLKGRYFWNKRDAVGLKKAIEYFQRAIAADPSYAAAYSGLADAYALAGGWEYGVLSLQEAAPLAKEAAAKAVLLDPALSEAHTSLAFTLDLYPWDWDGSEKEFRRALELNPNYATAHHWYGYHLMMMGRDEQGIAELRRAENLDPLSLIISAGLADVLYIAHRFDEAMRQLQKTLEMDPTFAVAHYQMGQVLVQQHRFDAAVAEFLRAIALSGHSPAYDANLAYAYALSGHTADARRIAGELEQQWSESSGSIGANMAIIYAGLGDADQAMRWLNQVYGARLDPVILVRPQFDTLRSDPRFKEFMRRLRLGN